MKKYTLIIGFLFIGFSIFAQKSMLFQNPQKWDEYRYEDMQGSPFFFKEFVKGDIHEIGGKIYRDLDVNLNGYTRNIEVRRGDEFIELEEGPYYKVEARSVNKDGDTTNTVFATTAISQFDGRFVQLVYDGEKRKLFNDFLVTISENKAETPGKTLVIKRFARKPRYFLLEDGELRLFKLKKKNILLALGHKKEIETFAKKNKIKIDSAVGVAKVLEYLEGLD
ncbi:MAG TPA: hypothetical protein ENJ95_07570 [Bacteroidetes bacterium]|nr:hypothetical protein [Bacteroidota bacterium]